ncbi:GGDEF domain-containing protein [Colwellia psychrerythraea]|uniref:diguanylate cyclase n=1 Tax=Colwellia psychrerythraea TaxID=28229 RepID=A0A099KR24_COLPS|nr:GGDEF domain-containing protein [Colwellia psychrerythraea]KGJ92630.1 diguanylate cyclase [Colwellia psychrerythraea]
MKPLVRAKIVGFTSWLITYSPTSFAITEQNAEHLCFGMGFFLGSLATLLLGLYLTRHYRMKYQKILQQLKLAKSNVKIAEQTMVTLAKEQQDSQDLLEERVQERTLELNIALQELESANQELERKNVLDELTGLHNRRFYDQKIVAEYRRSRRNLTALSLVLIDVDLFKTVNDTHGHLAGDQCLIWLANHIKQSLKRSTDRAFRYGGEEFCLILPNTDAEGALLFAEQLRLQVHEQPFQFRDIKIPLTISCGISTYQQQVDIGPEQIFSGADNALYQAKHNGRNQTKQHIFTE